MFDAPIYVQRRDDLKKKMQSGLILFIGNDISPMNCPENGHRILGQAIPKTVEEIENIISAGFLPVLRPEQI